jgi:predicted MPP superfamily phosphohydrolase
LTGSGRGRAAAALGAAALSLCYLLYESQWLRVVEHVLELPGLPPDLDGFTVVQLSDLHAGSRPSFNMRAVRKAVDETRRIAPDLIVITGDLVTGASHLDGLYGELRRLPEARGVFAVLGNHDHGVMKLVKAPPADLSGLAGAGVRLLLDECVSVTVGAATVQICGVDDVVNGYGHIESVLAALDRRQGTLRLLLSHYGEVAADLAPDDFALTLSGDTHGGQICLPVPKAYGGRIMLSQPRARFREGFYDEDGARVFVSRGIGTSFLPFRLLCRPEIVCFRLRRVA